MSEAMKSIKQILYVGILVLAGTLAASAQKDGKQKDPPPPKEKPPVVKIIPKGPEKPKENERPKDDENRGKKPRSYFE